MDRTLSPLPAKSSGSSSSSSPSLSASSSGSETLSEGGVKKPLSVSGCSTGSSDSEGQRTVREEEQSRGRVCGELWSLVTALESRMTATESPRDADPAGQEKQEELDIMLSPPSIQLRKTSNPEILSAKSLNLKRELSEDGRQFRRGSLGGALTGRYLLPSGPGQQPWLISTETTNLLRMRSQTLGQSAPSLTASLVLYVATSCSYTLLGV